MKQLKLLACTIMLATFSKAQYFQGKYAQNPSVGGTGMNGMRTSITGSGHLLGGLFEYDDPLNPCYPSHAGLLITRTDDAGGFSSPANFNNTYLFQDAGGHEIRLSCGQVLEYKDGSGYGAIFTYYQYLPSPGSCESDLIAEGVAFVRLDVFGNVLTVVGFPLPGNGSFAYVNDIRESRWTSGDIFATGEWTSSTGEQFWALRVKQNGTLVWGKVYSHSGEMPRGIIDAPTDSKKAVIVGYVPNSLGADGFFMTISASTGAPIITNRIDAGGTEYFNSINQSDEPGNPGYILGGYSQDMAWLTKTDYAGNLQWARQYQPVGLTNPLYAFDVKGRFNTMQGYEYYATGPYIIGSSMGDAFIFRTDQSGNPMNPNAISFYNTGSEETTKRIDVNTSGTNDGVSAYGVVETGRQREGYIVKAYFNGVTACDQISQDLKSFSNQWAPTPFAFATQPLLNQPLSLLSMQHDLDDLLCNAPVVPGGDNFRTAVSTGIKTQGNTTGSFNLFPNPCNTSLKPVVANITSATTESAKVVVVNMLGQEVYNQSHALQPGDNTLQLDLTSSSLSNGVYEISIHTSSGVQSSRFISDNTK